MILRTPGYYKKFKCTASKCRDNCCLGGWLIELDEDTVRYYRGLEGEFGKALCESLMTDDDGDTCFRLVEGRCPHLDESGLCRVLGEIGEEHMGVVCREFPRYTNIFGGVTEKGIGLACEEAARLILTNQEAFYLTEEIYADDDGDGSNKGDGDADSGSKNGSNKDSVDGSNAESSKDINDAGNLIDMLLSARNGIFEILSDRSRGIQKRMADVLEFAFELQQEINEPEPGCDWQLRHEGKYERESNGKLSDIREGFELLTDIFDSLEALNEKWHVIIEAVREVLFDDVSDEAFKEMLHAAEDTFFDMLFENLMNYFVFRYFMKAVEDCNPFDKIRFAVCSCLIIWEILAAPALRGEDVPVGQNPPACGEEKDSDRNPAGNVPEDIISLVKIFSRQVEYSEDNVEQICEEFLFGDDFDVDRLTDMVLV